MHPPDLTQADQQADTRPRMVKLDERIAELERRVAGLENRERERESAAAAAMEKAQEAFKREGVLGIIKGLMAGKANGEART